MRTRKLDESVPTALTRIIAKNRSRYGGYIVHIGIVFMFIGFVGKAFDADKEWTMQKGDEVHIAGYAITLTEVNQEERPNHFAWIASLSVKKDDQHVADLHPEKRIYFHTNPDPNRRQPHSELDLHSTFREDVLRCLWRH